MLLGYAHIEITLWKFLRKFDHAGAFAHGRRDADQVLVLLRHIAQPVAEYLRVAGLGGWPGDWLGHDALRRVKFSHAVIKQTIFFGARIALALLRDHVQELRPLKMADVVQRGKQHVQIVAINGTDVIETEFLEQRARRDHALDVFLGALGEFQHWRHALQHLFAAAPHGGIKTPRQQLGQIVVKRAHWPRDGHVVVVENDQQIGVHRTRIVQCLECHATAHRAVADDGHRAPVAARYLRRHRHAQRRRNRGAGMRGAKSIVGTLVALGEAGNAACHAQRFHGLAPPGEYLMGVGLVPHVPHQLVVRRVKYIMQRDGQLHRAQIGGQMAAGLADRLHQKLAHLIRQLRQLLAFQLAQRIRSVDRVEQGIHQNFLNTIKSASSRRRRACAPKPPNASSASRCSSAAICLAACTPSSDT